MSFQPYPISSIHVNRATRQRRELKNIPELAASLASPAGQINPILIKKDGELVAGERRLEAARSLGWTHIMVQFREDLSDDEWHLIELVENIQRNSLEWPDECRAVAEYHQLRAAADSEWTTEKTGDMLGWSARAVQEKLNVAKEITRGNKMVVEANNYSTARGIVTRANERKAASAVLAVKLATPSVQAETILPAAKPVPLLHADFHEWAETYSGPKFNFIHCDFPYGINANNQQQGHQAQSLGSYEDGPDVYWKLLDELNLSMGNVIHESAHLMFWFSMDYYADTKQRLEDMGWSVNPFPLIWHKSDNTGLLPDPTRGPRRIYETCLIASRSDRPIVRAKSNLFSHPGKDKSIHMSEKPVPMLRYFMEMFVDEYSNVLDPTCGSGNALKAAQALGAASVLGLEKDETFYERAKEHYYGEE